MATNNKVVEIEVSVGQLPEWYNEGEHDGCLEDAIETNWHKNSAYQDASVRVVYNYSSEQAIVKAWNEDGDLMFSRDNHDLGYAFDYAKENC